MKREEGAGSILAIGILGAVILLCATVLPLYAVLATKSSVAGAADAAALAAADARVGVVGGFACDVASEVATANGSSLVSCELDGLVATVCVARVILGFELSASATAGPGPGNTD